MNTAMRIRSPYLLSVTIALTGGVLVGAVGQVAELSRGALLLIALPVMLAALAPVAIDEIHSRHS